MTYFHSLLRSLRYHPSNNTTPLPQKPPNIKAHKDSALRPHGRWLHHRRSLHCPDRPLRRRPRDRRDVGNDTQRRMASHGSKFRSHLRQCTDPAPAVSVVPRKIAEERTKAAHTLQPKAAEAGEKAMSGSGRAATRAPEGV